ncbi:sulfite exporter TauE/SafE family protein [Breoghania sp. JC706]|uniref:sulfite exporter TauE/SafE family protein n=1 Tax=Breoghania sp. JC706 TaxID=3117732 RepID=UPI0030091D97
MDLTADWGYLASLVLALLASGAIAGFLAGVFGIGGGAVLVPILYQFLSLLGVDPSVCMHVSVATSLGIVVPTSIRSFLAHKSRGAVDLKFLKDWLIPVPIGAIVATFVAAYVSGAELKGIFAVIAVIIGLRMLFNRDSWRFGNDIPGNPARAVFGFVIGFFSTLMGVGGGVMNNTFMTLFGRPIHQAVATSSGVGILISIPAVIGLVWAGWGEPNLPPFSLGYINLLGVILVIPVTIFCAPFGVRVAHALSKRAMEISFGIFLLIVAARFAWSLWG